jgi:ATP-binding protein involved in chromosome partitioning
MPNQEEILEALKAVQDPDLHKDIVTLGFVRNVRIEETKVDFDLVLTTPACPVKDRLSEQAKAAVMALPGVKDVEVRLSATPAANQPDKANVLPGVRHVIAIASGKGGVGKSTVTANLACALASLGAAVGVLDADIYGPSQVMMLGVSDDPEIDENKRLYPPLAHGLKVISMAMFSGSDEAVVWRGPMVSQMAQNFVRQVEWGTLDYLLIDMPPGTGDVQLTLSQSVPLAGAVIVSTPQDVALLDARKGLKMFEKVSVPVLGMVENMSGFICDGCGKRHDIFKSGGAERVSRTLGVPHLGSIPIEPAVAQCGDAGVPAVLAHPESESGRQFLSIAQELARALSVLEATKDKGLADSVLEWDSLPEEEMA